MTGLSGFPGLRHIERAAVAYRLFFAVAVIMVTVGFLAGCAHADRTNYSGFQGETDDWVGTCPATFAVGTATAGMIHGMLTVMCDHRPTVEETVAGPFVPGNAHYHAVVTGIQTAPNFTYDQDKSFDLTLTPGGCSMSGTVTDADGNSNISFDSTRGDCSMGGP